MEEIVFGTYRKDAEGRNGLFLSKTKDSFEKRMLAEVKPAGFLRLLEGGPGEYGYDISGKKTLAVTFERVPMNAEQIRRVIDGILQTAIRAGEYLLNPDSLLISPDYIYLNFPEYETALCYYPEIRIPFFRQLGKLFEIFLNRVDYREEQAISLVYGLYMLLQEPDVTIGKIQKRIHGEDTEEIGEVLSEQNKSAISYNETYRMQEPQRYSYADNGRRFEKAEYPEKKNGGTEKRKQETVQKKKSEGTERKKSWFGTLFHKEPSYEFQTQPLFVEEAPPEWGGQQTRVLSVSGVRKEPSLVSERNGEVFYLTKFPFFIGSLSGYSDLVIARDTVSRFHAKLVKTEQGTALLDLNSTNGTQVNGAVIPMQQEISLKNGDRITFADETYRFYLGGQKSGIV